MTMTKDRQKTCGNCVFCYDRDAFEMDGLCQKQSSAEDNKNYTYLDSPACKNWQQDGKSSIKFVKNNGEIVQ